MNKEATLIAPPGPRHIPPALTGNDKLKVDEFYQQYGVQGGTPEEKNEILKKEIQARTFFALGGNETPEIELRANERIFLMQQAGK